MAIIVTVNAGAPLAGLQYEIAGTVVGRGSGLTAAIASELGFAPSAVTIQAPNVFVSGIAYATLSEGILDRPANRKIATLFRQYIHNHDGDRDTVVMMAFKACIRYAKKVRGMSKTQVTNLVGSLYDAIDANDD